MALRTTKAGGRVVVSGIPAGGADLTPLWFRELELVGAYTTGIEETRRRHGATPSRSRSSSRARSARCSPRWSGATYPLARWRDAIDHAMSAGRLGTFKVAFAPQESSTASTPPRSTT